MARAKADLPDLDLILYRVDNGDSVPAIARELGVGDATIYRRMLTECPERWKAAQAAKALADLEKADESLGTAADAIEVSRAREQLRSAQWRLERVANRIYGPQVAERELPPIAIQINIGSPDVGRNAGNSLNVEVKPVDYKGDSD
jgi:hypothetical protein